MPNYDLGTARGKIKLEADTRGASNAERALKAFERSIGALAGKLGSFEAAMNKIEAELKDAKTDFEKAERASDGFERSIGRADTSTRAFSSDILELKSRLKGIQTTIAKVAPPAIAMTNVFREFRKTGKDIGFVEQSLNNFLKRAEMGDVAAKAFVNLFGRPQQNNVIRMATALHRVGLTSIILSTLQGKLIGTSQALKTVTGQQASILKAAGSFRTFAFGVGIAAATAKKLDLLGKATNGLTYALGPFNHHLARLKTALSDVDTPTGKLLARVRAMEPGFKSLSQSIQGVWKNMDLTAKGAVQLVGGIALARYGINGLIQRFNFIRQLSPMIKAALAGALYVGPAVFQALGKSLSFVSNLLVGLLNGIKQLAGGFLAIPGGISLAVAAFGTLKLITAGLSDTFGDLMKAIKDGDPKKIAEAMDKLPPSLKGVGQALADVIPKWKALSTNAAGTFLSGAEDQIRKLSDGLIPVLGKGIDQIANSWRLAKDQVVDFAKQGQTLSDLGRLSMLTAQTMNQLSGSIQPVLSGFRDIAIVGAQFLRDLSAGVPDLAQKFAAWAQANRQNGQLMQWMQNGLRGLKDLTHGLEDAGKATWALLTMFKTNNGDNFLDKFAASMAKFNDKVEKSLSSGGLKTFADWVKSAGTDRIKSLWEVLKQLGDALIPIGKFATDVSRAFNTVMTPAIEFALKAIQTLFEVLNNFGVGNALGTILGLVGAFKILANIFGPLRNLFQIFLGAFTGFKGAQNIILGLAGALENFGGIGKKASGALMGVGDAVSNTLSKFAIAGTALAVFWGLWEQGVQEVQNAKDAIADAATHAADNVDQLKDAFMADNGIQGRNVFSQVKSDIDEMMADLKTKADSAEGIAGRFVDAINRAPEISKKANDDAGGGVRGAAAQVASARTGQSSQEAEKQVDDFNKQFEAAQKAKDAFDKLGMSNQQLAQIVSGSQANFDQFTQTLKDSGDNGKLAADELSKYRDTFNKVQADFAALGPGGAKVAEGIKQIADAGGDAQTKLEGLKTALEGLGLLQTNYYENAASYAEAIQGLGDAAADAVDKTKPLNDILDSTGNLINVNSANGRNLINVLSPIGDKFLAAATSGGDVNKMWADMQGQLADVAKSFNLPIEKVQQLVGQFGALPDSVSILLSVQGKDQATQDIAAVITTAKANIGNGVDIPVHMDSDAAAAQISKTINDILHNANATYSQGTNLFIRPGIDPAGIAAVTKAFADKGISLDGAAVPPGAQAKAPVAPTPAAPAPGAPPPPVAPAPKAPAPAAAVAPSPAPQQVGQVTNAVQGLKDATPGGKVEFTIIAHGYDETVAVINRVKDAITQLIDEVNKLPGVFAAAFATVQGTMNTLVSNAANQGSAFVDAFASGLRNNPAATKAAEDMAQAIKDRFHNSPPKKGPLSQHGDQAKYAGGAFVDSYAAGMQAQYPVAGKAANGMASLLSSMSVPAGAGIPGGTTPFLGQLSDLLQLFEHINSSFSEISGLFTSAAKLISDPLGKGTFFGQSAGAAFGFKRDPTISDADLAQKRQDQAAKDAKGTGKNSGYSSDDALLANVPKGIYSQKGQADLTKGLGDCSSAVEDLVNIMDGAPTGGRQMSTGNAAAWLTQRGFKPGAGGPGDMRVAFNVEHMQATLPGGTNFNWGSDAAAAARGLAGSMGADDPALTQRYYRPAANGYFDSTLNPNSNVHQGTGALPGPIDQQKNANNLQTLADNSTTTNQTQDQMLQTLRSQDTNLDQAIKTGQDPNSTDTQVANSLSVIQKSIDAQNNAQTPEAKAQLEALGQVQQGIMENRGMTTGDNPIDSISNAAAAASNIGSDVMSTLQSGIEAFGAANDLVNMANRYPSNSEDVMKAIDDVQKFIELGAKIASTVSDVLSTAGSFTGGSDFGGTAAAGQVASLVSGALTAVNNVIDIGQEVYKIVGSYLGPFLGQLAGGMGGALEGNVKMLLDENAGQLFTYSADNPQDKRGHNIPGAVAQGEYQQAIGQVNVYGGPGSDPRDNTRDMMFQVRAAQQQRALAS